MDNSVCFLSWIKKNQKGETNLNKRSHMSTVIKYYNLLARADILGRDFKSVSVAPTAG